MLDLGHEVQYSKTHEDLLYGSSIFAGVYAGANFLSRLGAPQKLPGMLALGAHGTALKSNFLLGLFGNAYNVTNRAAHKIFGNYGFAKQMMTNEGLNVGFLNFRTQSVDAFNAAGGYGSSVLPGINVSTKGQMAKYLDSTADFTSGMADNISAKLSRQNIIDDGVSAVSGRRAKAVASKKEAAKQLSKAEAALKESKTVMEGFYDDFQNAGSSFDEMLDFNEQIAAQEKIIAANQNAVDDAAKAISSMNTGKITAKEAAKQYGDEAAEKIVANLSDDALLKYGGKELAGKAIATEAERAALRTAAKTEIGRQVATQVRNAAFAKTLAGRGLSGVGALAGAVGKFLFSLPVQTILMGEMALNLSASARTNNQVRNIKEYQGAKQAYFNNPATQAAIQKGGAIYQNNNNDLNFLLSSPNVATQVANRR